MTHKKFTLWHSLAGITALVATEGILLWLLPRGSSQGTVLLFIAAVGAVLTIYVATEVIEEVKSAAHMLVLLCVVLFEFLLFFTFQYVFLLLIEPASFPTLSLEPVTLLLHSTFVFAFNPLYLPETGLGRALMLINTFGSLGIVLFVLQNIWQFRSKNI